MNIQELEYEIEKLKRIKEFIKSKLGKNSQEFFDIKNEIYELKEELEFKKLHY